MKLEQQVVSLELAKKLKELGVKQESLYVYYDIFNKDNKTHFSLGTWNEHIPHDKMFPDAGIISAFTVAELGELLKPHTKSFQSFDEGDKWCAWHKDTVMRATTEADARAKMLIYLLENNLIKNA